MRWPDECGGLDQRHNFLSEEIAQKNFFQEQFPLFWILSIYAYQHSYESPPLESFPDDKGVMMTQKECFKKKLTRDINQTVNESYAST